MWRVLLNRRVWLAALIVGGLVAVALWPSTVAVDVATVSRGPLVVTVDEEGQTRVRQRYVVSAPVSGRVLRIDLEPGDPVKRNDIVARVQPEAPPLLDARTRAEAQAAVAAAQAALGRARAEAQRASAALAQAERERTRAGQMLAAGVASQQEVDARQAELDVARENVNAAEFAVRAAESDLQRAQARLAPAPATTGAVVSVRAPADGVVLRRVRESESIVPAGEPLVEIGNPQDLEIVADLLSTDAVQVKPGSRAIVEQWGGARELAARVRRVEPSGFTKISALGVEEQRVNVILDFEDPAHAWSALGDGYRVEVRIVLWESPDVLKVPTGALFREGTDWAVYVIANGRVRRTVVALGKQTGREAEVVSGITEGTRVVLYPGDTLTDGARIEER
jgi:HlyD family secretion protein